MVSSGNSLLPNILLNLSECTFSYFRFRVILYSYYLFYYLFLLFHTFLPTKIVQALIDSIGNDIDTLSNKFWRVERLFLQYLVCYVDMNRWALCATLYSAWNPRKSIYEVINEQFKVKILGNYLFLSSISAHTFVRISFIIFLLKNGVCRSTNFMYYYSNRGLIRTWTLHIKEMVMPFNFLLTHSEIFSRLLYSEPKISTDINRLKSVHIFQEWIIKS